MKSVSVRRQFLQLGGTALAAGLAGCSMLDREPADETRITELMVVNHNERRHTVHALLQDDDEVVYWSSIQATPAKKDANRAGGGKFTGYPTSTGADELYVKADNQPNGTWTTARIDDSDVPCVHFVIHLGAQSDSQPEDVTINRQHPCDPETID